MASEHHHKHHHKELNTSEIKSFVDSEYDKTVVPNLMEFIKIPNMSPLFDPECHTNGLQEKAANHIISWIKTQKIAGLTVELIQFKGKTPLIFIEIPAFGHGSNDTTILMYAHFDKQPPLTEAWDADKGPYKPVLTADGKLYGRGGADDGYGTAAALVAIAALQAQGLSHHRVVMTVEGCEESGSPDLPAYIEHLEKRIGVPALVVCLDSGCANYDQLWVTSSLRGLIAGTLRVDLLTEGAHSGYSGKIADTFRILRRLLDRLEDPDTGRIIAPGFDDGTPPGRLEEIKATAAFLGDQVWTSMPLIEGARPLSNDPAEILHNYTWRPFLSVTGVDGMPTLQAAGNVLRPFTAVKLSLRLPPNVDGKAASARLKVAELLEANPPYGAKVTMAVDKSSTGWDATPTAEWLAKVLKDASMAYYGKPACFEGGGGSIPFMGMLGKKFPEAQFVVTGALGPKSNAHGPNEFLSIPMAKGVTSCVANVIYAQYLHSYSKKK